MRKAAELIGGRQALADRLDLARPDIDAWIADQRRPALVDLLRIVEVILDESEERQD